jgi:hypothetical protein
MNNIIDKLFVEAGGYVEIDKNGYRWTYSQECDPDKFVELIIKECVRIIDNQATVESERVGLKAYHKAEALYDLSTVILKKFNLTLN